ncbi:hypothetical protein [Streptomyces sp. VRA16 Mangrove soil]|uniref:hypothetical protein n=1 Tax=Streptomyces sp. VRA16 Mangrove soil TaxID=2817434 RepID=UPI001A9F55CA|nr:hypothetical protein [Streptomyces sp. VRA16 Mangrove soil]MBO1337414.1 hypothetical protein [Streptomyces sp. VRA16 Mangrove soil]
MNSTRRVLTAVLLAAGATAIAVPTAGAAPLPLGGEPISPTTALDSVSGMAVPDEYQGQLPSTAQQLSGLNRLNELHQATDLVAPVTNAIPSVQ